jgi:hypothetical protein
MAQENPSQEVIDASWEAVAIDLPPVGSPVQFFTNDRRRQWTGVGVGPYAAIVTAYGANPNSLNLYVFPCQSAMPPQLYENVPTLGLTNDLVWWRTIPYQTPKGKKK